MVVVVVVMVRRCASTGRRHGRALRVRVRVRVVVMLSLRCRLSRLLLRRRRLSRGGFRPRRGRVRDVRVVEVVGMMSVVRGRGTDPATFRASRIVSRHFLFRGVGLTGGGMYRVIGIGIQVGRSKERKKVESYLVSLSLSFTVRYLGFPTECGRLDCESRDGGRVGLLLRDQSPHTFSLARSLRSRLCLSRPHRRRVKEEQRTKKTVCVVGFPSQSTETGN